MFLVFRCTAFVAACCLCLDLSGCKPKASEPDASAPADPRATADAPLRAMLDYRSATRMAYNNRRFDDLEQNANEAASSKAKFGNGSWKVFQFYDSLGRADTEPESMWQLHGEIYKAWIAAKPESVAAHVAQVAYFLEYAWRARGTGFADTVTDQAQRMFTERLRVAHKALIDSEKLCSKNPVWWSVGMRIAVGEGWPRENFEQFYAHAKALEPTFWNFDTQRSRYLSLKWYGQPGDWEAAAETASSMSDGLGMEIYARCVLEQYRNYKDVFKETRATWTRSQQGFALMEQRYPDSLEVARAYCRLACLVGDRPTAKRLFDRLGDNAWADIWVDRGYLQRAKAWAYGTN